MSAVLEAVERPDNLHIEILREARRLGLVALPEHHGVRVKSLRGTFPTVPIV